MFYIVNKLNALDISIMANSIELNL